MEVLFWIFVFIVFYTYLGYGILLYLMVKIKELFCGKPSFALPHELPQVTLLIAAYNEEEVVKAKMENSLALNYPASLLKIIWITDGSTDQTNQLLEAYPQIEILFSPQRQGKSAAINRAIPFVKTPIVVFTDANTMICAEAINEIVKQFTNPKVGCVAGEKRIALSKEQDATAGEGIYWRYESTLKDLDYRLYSATGAAGELFAIRTPLYVPLPNDTLLDDFVLSMKIAMRHYKIAYSKNAYAIETASADITQEAKRKVRIAAGGMQSIFRLLPLLNIFRYGVFTFQYVSHRVLRWSITPIFWFLLLPLNLLLAVQFGINSFYFLVLFLHLIFYLLAALGYVLNKKQIKNKYLFIPYYALFMNVSVIQGFGYLYRNKNKAAIWEKATRKNECT